MPANHATDAEDVRRTLAGDPQAFGRLYDRHARGVRAVVAAVSCDFAAVEDLTQETFLRAYARLASLRDTDRFQPWIQGIARHVARERRRALARDRHEPLDTAGAVSSLPPEQTLEDADEATKVFTELAQLPEGERLAIHAYFFASQRADAAAERLGLSRSGFYATPNRALERLRSRLQSTSRFINTGGEP